MELVTGFHGKNHVTAEQMADFNRGIYGNAAILPIGSRMAVEIQTANRITVKDGVAVFDGREVYIGYGKNEAVNLTSGTQGMKRNDIVVVEYKKEEKSGVESVAFKVVLGTPNAVKATDPHVNDADIRTGTNHSEKPFCRVRLNGTAIEGIDMLVEVKEFKKHAFSEPAKTYTVTQEGIAADAKLLADLKKEMYEELSGYFTVNYGWEVSRLKCFKTGQLIHLSFTAHPSDSWMANTKYTVLKHTLPERYYPTEIVIAPGVDANGDLSSAQTCAFAVGFSPNIIEIYTGDKNTTGYFTCNLTYQARG